MADNKFAPDSFTDGSRWLADDTRRFAGIPTFLKAPMITASENPTVGIVGVPYDGGTARTPGSRFGPREVRNNSWRINEYNPELKVNPFAIHNIVDCGDYHISPFDLDDAFAAIENGSRDLLAKDLTLLSVGGDHSITHPILRAVNEKHGKIALIHFDAHTDTVDVVYGKPNHHGSLIRRAIEEELVDAENIIQVGIRKIFYEGEMDFAKEHGLEVITSRDIFKMGGEVRKVMSERFARLRGHKVYVTFDMDFVDPTFAPGTGGPEIAGPNTDQTLECLRAIQGLDVIGCDIAEIHPTYDVRGLTTLLAAQILFEMVSVIKPTI